MSQKVLPDTTWWYVKLSCLLKLLTYLSIGWSDLWLFPTFSFPFEINRANRRKILVNTIINQGSPRQNLNFNSVGVLIYTRDGHRPEAKPKSGLDWTGQFGPLNWGFVDNSPPPFNSAWESGLACPCHFWVALGCHSQYTRINQKYCSATPAFLHHFQLKSACLAWEANLEPGKSSLRPSLVYTITKRETLRERV